MLGVLKALFDNPQREARRLNRDAAAIIDNAIKSLPVERVRDTAVMIHENLAEAHENLESGQVSRDAVLQRYRQLHGEARRGMNQVGLTAFTLVIIHLRAESLGEPGRPALEAIDEFTGQWAHAVEQASSNE